MAERKIILTPRAEEDLREIFLYLAEFSLNAADAQAGKILSRIDLLANFPKLGRVLPDYNNERLRELVIGLYLVAYYIVSDDRIDILSIHHSAKPKG